jgi:hypothetical protein
MLIGKRKDAQLLAAAKRQVSKNVDYQTLRQTVLDPPQELGVPTYSIYHVTTRKIGVRDFIILRPSQKVLHNKIDMLCICIYAFHWVP